MKKIIIISILVLCAIISYLYSLSNPSCNHDKYRLKTTEYFEKTLQDEGYDAYENDQYEQISSKISLKNKNLFDEKWKNSKFRHDVIIARNSAAIMDIDGCDNAYYDYDLMLKGFDTIENK